MTLKIALLGYGKMGKMIHELALENGDEVVFIADSKTTDFSQLKNADVGIEFSNPESGFSNVMSCLKAGIPVVSGTTGWNNQIPEAEKFCKETGGAMLVASNFSLGVNLFFALNAHLAEIMAGFHEYNSSIVEIHHTAKKDAPSGTAITLAEGILAHHPFYSSWKLAGTNAEKEKKEIPITAIRQDPVPGTHTITWNSEIDQISISHVAHSRKGFASGALLAARWMLGKSGVFSMKNLLTPSPKS
jgi:4-hydroxy-tetrahydrodipicolinate reductase